MIDRDIEQTNRDNILDLSNDEPDRTGEWYGKLQAIRQTDKAADGTYSWLCLCSCLGVIEVMGSDLDLCIITHCGCEDKKEPEYEIEHIPTFKKPVWMTQGQMDLLMLIVPGPLGRGMKVVNAAKILGVSEGAARMKLKRFKHRFPEAWDRIEGIRNTMKTHGRTSRQGKVGGVKSFDCLVADSGEAALNDMIKHRF